VLLPDAPQPYRDEVAQMIIAELSGEGDDDEGDDDDDDDADGTPTEPSVAVLPAPRVKNGQRVRA